MDNIFHDDSHQLRSGWRAAIFLFAFLFLSAILRIAEETAVSLLPIEADAAKLVFFTVNSAILLVLALVLGCIAGKVFERVPFRAIGASFTNSWLKHLLLGVVIGSATLIVAVLFAFVFGGERFELNLSAGANTVVTSLVLSLVVFALGAAWEEAFFRGYVFQTFVRSGLAWVAIVLTSTFFGLVHIANQNSTAISTINTVLAGLWFGFAYLKTRDLWFVWGMHLMWNWMQGSIFGIEVSGLTQMTTNPLFREIDTGPTWLTGSDYGLEGGVACTFALAISMVVIYYLPKMRNEK